MSASAHPYLGDTEDRKKWLKERQSGIGASDIACLYGLGFLDPSELFRSKVETDPQLTPMNERMRLGLELEPCIAARYEETTGYKTKTVRGTTKRPGEPIAFASLDRVREDESVPVELKAVFGPPGGSSDWKIDGDGWGDEGTDAIPQRYLLQTQWQMGAFQAPICDVAALFVGYTFRVYRVEFNATLYAAMLDDAREFWNYCALLKDPGADWRPRRLDDVKALAKRAVPGSETILPPESDELVERYKRATSEIKLFEADKSDAVAQLEKYLDHYETGYTPAGHKIARISVKAYDVPARHQPAGSHVRVFPKKGKGL